MSVNKVILMGNVCHTPKVTTFDDGGKVAQFSLATNKRGFKTQDGREVPEQTEFHNIVINRTGLAGVAEQYVKKGDKVYLEGELRTRKYENEGASKYITEVYVSTMELLTPKEKGAPTPNPEANPFAGNYDDAPY